MLAGKGIVVAALLAGTLVSSACSFLLHDDARQCDDNSGCARFPGTICNLTSGVCVPGYLVDGGAEGGGRGGQGGGAGLPNVGGAAGGTPSGRAGSGGAPGGLGGGGQPGSSAGACPDLDGNGVPDCTESLVPNSGFMAGISGWTAEAGITASFTSSDGKGDPHSGSLAITNPIHVDTASGLTMAGATLCLTKATGAAYDVYLEVAVGGGTAGVTQGGITFGYYPTTDCSGTESGIAPTTLIDQTVMGWRLMQEIIRPTAGTQSLLVRLVVVKPFNQPTGTASFDNLLIRPR